MANLTSILDSIKAQVDFKNDEVEVLVEAAFVAGARAMIALLSVDDSNDGEPAQDLTDYISGIAGLTQSVGAFLGSLTDEQEAAYRANLKKVIVNVDPNVELALEDFADANLDLTAAILEMNDVIDELENPVVE